MISLTDAIDEATKHAPDLVKGITNILVEQVLISDDRKLIEVTLSYENPERERFTSSGLLNYQNPNLKGLAGLLRHKRDQKVFLVDSETGAVRGFRNLRD